LRKLGIAPLAEIRQLKQQIEIIAITDAGCTLDKQWLAELVKPFSQKADVVAGYYKAQAKTVFQKAAAAYMLVMPDHVDESNFLPATRSMAVKKSFWLKAGKFDPRYSHNEDYVFAHALKKIGAQIAFARDAIVYWQPPSDWLGFTRQAFRFAIGDSEAGIIRPKVALIFARYVVLCFVAYYSPLLAALALIVYVAWSVKKNYRYMQNIGMNILPSLQLTTI
jgi:cellulose synthase/poly-beta-1,6-N-acetylglucosamine synthase-like glycosyltransferase